MHKTINTIFGYLPYEAQATIWFVALLGFLQAIHMVIN